MSNKIPRLSFEELRADIAGSLAAKVQRLGYLGEFFAATAHQAVAVLMVMGRSTAHAIIVNRLGIGPPVPSIFEDGFSA